MAHTVLIKGFKEFKAQQILLIHQLSERQLQECAKATVTVMRFHIQTSIERSGSTGKLALGIFESKLTSGWGVGDIDYLNQNVPYWAWINYGVARTGRIIPPGTNENPKILGYFDSPTKGRFQKGPQYFPIFPTKPITAHNYIEKTVQQIPIIVNTTLKRFKGL